MEPYVRDFLKDIGINIAYLLAGLGGGLVNAISSRSGPWEGVGLVIIGGCIGAWVGEPIAQITHIPYPGFFSFMLGYGGMRSLEYLLKVGKEKFGIKGDI